MSRKQVLAEVSPDLAEGFRKLRDGAVDLLEAVVEDPGR